ncbi:GNAT family N-acetyltransferase [Streptacidiphilus melanogenes]|uniref:GNAT family N-acetyltransferase n=1 Tax=Streptacidiphilus melanogenes TaxID=411235 RepID=UPI0005AAF57E|nr:GNAT family protein [Streptacidiphilus melanogenes]
MTTTVENGRATTSVRLVEPADASAILAHLTEDAAALARWQPARPQGFYTGPAQTERIDRALDDHRAGRTWPGVILADGVVIGQITVATILRGPLGKGFLSYWVSSRAQGHGHASRAVDAVLHLMSTELGLHRAEAHTQVDNLASHHVLRTNGFSPWGLAHHHIHINGSWRDEIFWERLLG